MGHTPCAVASLAPPTMSGISLALTPAYLLRRWKRFLCEARLEDGTVVRAHVPNSGSMATLLRPDCPVWLRHDPSPRRKLAWTLVLMETTMGGLAVVDTMLPNRMAWAGIMDQQVPELAGYRQPRREASIPELAPHDGTRSRFDLVLSDHIKDARSCVVEIKNVTMLGRSGEEQPRQADFPDAKTLRGRRHLLDLAHLAAMGYRCVQWYICNRSDCDQVGIARDIDPAYGEALDTAMAAGVEVLCYRAAISSNNVSIGQAAAFIPS
ncbi:MAG: DNA/RNA nuclease SfsA [Planctomycetota bacterium]|nr:MAG: DNA/RNA nuclease SfsA [Planctomycetota bacterium]